MQAPHLTQPDKYSSPCRDRGAFGPMTARAPPCVGRLHGVLAHLRARGGRSRFHRACPMDATPQRDAAPGPTAF